MRLDNCLCTWLRLGRRGSLGRGQVRTVRHDLGRGGTIATNRSIQGPRALRDHGTYRLQATPRERSNRSTNDGLGLGSWRGAVAGTVAYKYMASTVSGTLWPVQLRSSSRLFAGTGPCQNPCLDHPSTLIFASQPCDHLDRWTCPMMPENLSHLTLGIIVPRLRLLSVIRV